MEQLAPAEPVRLANLGAVAAVRNSINGTLNGLSIINNQAAAIFVQIFDVATAGAVTLGTTVPNLEFNLAANATLVPNLGPGMRFRTGLQMASTTLEGGAVASAAGVMVFALVT
jgi:hypothetical protein